MPHWSNANQARWVSNHPKSVAFELAADHDVPVWMRRVQPLLVVRCLAHKADVFVFTDSPARIEPEDENHTVRVAFDDETGTTERWMDSEEHDALFAPDGAVVRPSSGAVTHAAIRLHAAQCGAGDRPVHDDAGSTRSSSASSEKCRM